jgi:tetratricopeptide (TPR) repeat protein
MGKKSRKERQVQASASSQNERPVQKKPAYTKTPGWVVPLILIICFVAFLPSLQAGFVNWDDDDYVVKNRMIKSLANIGDMITTPVQGNYHPVTMFSLAINFAMSGLDGWSYHFFNMVFHLVNCWLVFRLVMLLSKRNLVIAFTVAVFFAIHPMHAESVAWVSERKDLLYGMFFIAGLISYTRYVDTDSRKQYYLAFLFLVLSILSKPAAVIFPVVLFCIDILRARKLNGKLFAEKIIFLVPSIIMGAITLMAQKDVGATDTLGVLSIGSKVLFGFYGIMTYFFKMIVPLNLSVFYPFPAINQKLPTVYYVSPVFSILLAVVFFYFLKRNRVISFGISFYIANLLLVLQLFSVGSAVIAERYTYIPYIGLFYIAGWMINRYAKGNLSKANYIILPITLLFTILTFNQASVWKSSASLWDQAIRNQPSSRAYDNRAAVYNDVEKNPAKALELYSEAININAIDEQAYINRGNIYLNSNQLDLAYRDYQKALSLKPDSYTTYDNLGALYAMRGQYDSSLLYLNRSISIKQDYAPPYRNRALTFMQMNKSQEAINDFQKYLEFEPGNADIMNSIGACYQTLGKYNEALVIINQAIQLNPNVPQFYLNRSYCYNAMKNLPLAKQDALKAKQLGLTVDPAYAKSLGIE